MRPPRTVSLGWSTTERLPGDGSIRIIIDEAGCDVASQSLPANRSVLVHDRVVSLLHAIGPSHVGHLLVNPFHLSSSSQVVVAQVWQVGTIMFTSPRHCYMTGSRRMAGDDGLL